MSSSLALRLLYARRAGLRSAKSLALGRAAAAARAGDASEAARWSSHAVDLDERAAAVDAEIARLRAGE